MSLSTVVAEAITAVNGLVTIVKGQFGKWDGQVQGKINELEGWKNSLINKKTITVPTIGIPKNTPTSIANIKAMGVAIGTQNINITWDSITDTSVNHNYYAWYGGMSGIFYLCNTNNYNHCPPENLAMSGTVHHRIISLPIVTINSIDYKQGYSDLNIFLTFDADAVVNNLKITFTKIGD
jgi:hypothetical protein